MPDARRLTLSAVVFVVLLRTAIGWQFTYEGLWKLDTQDTATPWTAAGYLKNAQGPLRQTFRDVVDDPHDLDWVDEKTTWQDGQKRYYDKMIARWDGWHQRFLAHHPDLTAEQKEKLDALLNGREAYSVKLEQLPDGIDFGGSLGKAIAYDEKGKQLVVAGKSPEGHLWHLIPAERDRLLKMPVPEEQRADWQKAVRDVYAANAKLSYKERLAAHLMGDPEIIGDPPVDQLGESEEQQKLGELEVYRNMLVRQEKNRENIELRFQHQHLDYPAQELARRRALIAGPIRAMDVQLPIDARGLLTAEQLARGPVPPANTTLRYIDLATTWGLLVLGVLLMVGLLSRIAAFFGALLLFSFYLALPPWPGVIDFQSFGPDHSFIVDKNLIEALALLAIAALPTGRWFGIDAAFPRLRSRKAARALGGDSGSGGRPPEKTPPPSSPAKDQRRPVGSRQ
ncbi:MAG: hypothetical protein WED34_16655 [Planctomycetales bacterium]